MTISTYSDRETVRSKYPKAISWTVNQKSK